MDRNNTSTLRELARLDRVKRSQIQPNTMVPLAEVIAQVDKSILKRGLVLDTCYRTGAPAVDPLYGDRLTRLPNPTHQLPPKFPAPIYKMNSQAQVETTRLEYFLG